LAHDQDSVGIQIFTNANCHVEQENWAKLPFFFLGDARPAPYFGSLSMQSPPARAKLNMTKRTNGN
jgi:hypothetical protein